MQRHPILAFSAFASLATGVAAQDECAQGRVLDARGQPIASARVGIRWLPGHGDRAFHTAIADLLRASPLPSALTDSAGRYALALTRDHLLLGCGDGETFAFVVESPGFQRWVEPLPHGVRSFLGADARLVPLDAKDEVRFVVRDPLPGSWLLVRRSLRSYTAHYDIDPGELVPVPADGRVTVRYPLVPSPAIVPMLTRWCGIALDAQVLYPGRSSEAVSIDPERENLLSLRPPPADTVPATPRQAVYRARNGAELTFTIATRVPPSDPELELVGSADRAPLARATDPDSVSKGREPGDSLTLFVRDEDERPIEGASALLGSLLDAPRAVLGGAEVRTDAKGRVVFRDLPAARYLAVVVAQDHEAAQRKVATGSEHDFALARLPKHAPRVVSPEGAPLAFRWLTALDPGGKRIPVRTDGAGRLPRIPILSVHTHDWIECDPENPQTLTMPDGPHFVSRVPNDSIVIEQRHFVADLALPRPPATSLARGNLAILSLPLPGARDSSTWRFHDGSILRLGSGDGAFLPERGARYVSIDARAPELSLTLDVRGASGPITEGVLVTPSAMSIGTGFAAGKRLAEANPDGTWTVRVRSAQALRCWITHRDHVPAELVLPPLAEAGKRIAVRLERGVPFTIRRPSSPPEEVNRITLGAKLALGASELDFHVEVGASVREHAFARLQRQELPPGVVERAPFALPEGRHVLLSSWKGDAPLTIVATPGTTAELDLR